MTSSPDSQKPDPFGMREQLAGAPPNLPPEIANLLADAQEYAQHATDLAAVDHTGDADHQAVLIDGNVSLQRAEQLKNKLDSMIASYPDQSSQAISTLRRFAEEVTSDIQGYKHREQHRLGSVFRQRDEIRKAMYDQDFNKAGQLLEALKLQPDALQLAQHLANEYRLIRDLQEEGIRPDESTLHTEVYTGLGGLDFKSIDQLYDVVDQRVDLLSRLEKVKALAEAQGWGDSLAKMKEDVKKSFDRIASRAKSNASIVMDGNFYDAYSKERDIERSQEELIAAQEALDQLPSDDPAAAEPRQELEAKIANLQRIMKIWQGDYDLAIIQMGGKDIDNLEIVDDEVIDNHIAEIGAKLAQLEPQVDEIYKRQSGANRSFMWKTAQRVTGYDRAAVLDKERKPLAEEAYQLRKQRDAWEKRKKNQVTSRKLHTFLDKVARVTSQEAKKS